MSSAKAALESDTRVLAYEAGRKYGVRVNTISAGPLGSRAAKVPGSLQVLKTPTPELPRWRVCTHGPWPSDWTSLLRLLAFAQLTER